MEKPEEKKGIPTSPKLNDEQKRAVAHKDGPLLIIAGAGAGKTKTITERIMHLIQSGVSAEHILAITFTNKAAKEMRDRITGRLKESPGGLVTTPFIGTFHTLGLMIIRENARKLGLTRYVGIADQEESIGLVRDAIRERNLNEKQFIPGRIRSVISRHKGDLTTVEEFEQNAEEYFPKTLALIWRTYEKLLQQERKLDFDDLILKAVKLLENHSEILTHYHDRFVYLHVDEYQDTNTAQYRLTKLLASRDKNICVVGDSDQNIYSWRGANLRNILNFEKDYPDTEVILLEENYRSTKTILSIANDVIKKNKIRKEKNLFTHNEAGERAVLFRASDEKDEARFVAEKSRELIAAGVSPEDIAVLYRANFQSRVLEEAFLRATIPYQVLGTKFYERKEVKDVLAYIRTSLTESPGDFKRALNTPPRGIGKVTVVKIFSGKEETLPPKMKEKISDFRKILSRIKKVAETKKPSEVLRETIELSGIGRMLKQGSEDDLERYENIMELVSLATNYDTQENGLEKLLDDGSLESEQDGLKKTHNAVRLMTVHASKGLEFRYVFITGLEDEIFPHRRLQTAVVSEEDSEEERRLFYVAVTRAREQLFFTFADVRTIFGSRQINTPSEFLSDIPEHHLDPLNGETIISLD